MFFLDFWKRSLKVVLNKSLAKFIYLRSFRRKSTIVTIAFSRWAVLPNIQLRESFPRFAVFSLFPCKRFNEDFYKIKCTPRYHMQVKQFDFTF